MQTLIYGEHYEQKFFSTKASGTNPEASEYFEAALRAFNIYRGDPVALVDQAIDSAPEFAMAHILKAYLFGLATEPEAAAEAKTILETAKPLRRPNKRFLTWRLWRLFSTTTGQRQRCGSTATTSSSHMTYWVFKLVI
ncbi:hypothetical protein [Roseovarius rhodophyticola]|uniref:Tetratricopeptide repeat protein n=1 Tax=Roseovarius rhodophyticola TaxID=3080827 RepID=A0ABZ2THD0_9RHOB|nr:hypothetical protein [Roseovarius sp. W115]MDV2928767.1 hypothetical protein [Roseovarius sp. W115]